MTRSPVSVVAGRSVRPSIDLFGPFSGSDRRFFSLRSKERWLRRGTLPALLLGWVAATVGWLAPLAAQAPPGGGPEITNVVASGPSKVDVTYSLDQNYPGGKTGQVRLEIFLSASGGALIDQRAVPNTQGTHTITGIELGRTKGYFVARLVYDTVGNDEEGTDRGFYLENQTVTLDHWSTVWIGNTGVFTVPINPVCGPALINVNLDGTSTPPGAASVVACQVPPIQDDTPVTPFPPIGCSGNPGTCPSAATGGCATCGGGAGVSTPGTRFGLTAGFSIKTIAQYSTFPSNLSPGFFTPYDSSAYVFTDTSNNQTVLRIVDVCPVDILTFEQDASAGTGNFKESSGMARKAQLFDANNNLTYSIQNAVKAVLTRHDGSTMEFELYEVDDGDSTLDKDGRVTKMTDARGRSVTITYQNPSGGTKINQVTGPDGKSITFTYSATQQSGRDVLDSVTLPNGQTLAFAYSGGFLSQATISENGTLRWKWTCSITTNSTSQTTDFLITSPAQGVRTIKYTQDYIELSGQLLDQPEAIVRGIYNGLGENVKAIYIDPNDPNAFLLWEGDDFLSRVELGKSHAFMTSWTANDPSQGYNGFTFTQENSYPRNDFDSGSPQKRIILGAPQRTYDAAGYLITWDYDADYFPIKATYGDNTYESWQYNANHQVTRHRDRLGRVTKFVYDSAGRLIEKHVGILEVSGSDVNQPEYGVYRYEYNSFGQVTKVMDPLYNAANPDLHVTDYTYDSAGRLTQVQGSADVASGSRPTTTYGYDASGRLSTVTDPDGHATTYTYDYLDRVVTVTYADGSTTQTLYGSPGTGLETAL